LVTLTVWISSQYLFPSIAASYRENLKATGVAVVLVVGATVSCFWYGSLKSGAAALATPAESAHNIKAIIISIFFINSSVGFDYYIIF
jgi:hypothetical protein